MTSLLGAADADCCFLLSGTTAVAVFSCFKAGGYVLVTLFAFKGAAVFVAFPKALGFGVPTEVLVEVEVAVFPGVLRRTCLKSNFPGCSSAFGSCS